MKNSFITGSYFNNVCALIGLVLLLLGCSESPSNFTEFLYELADIDVQERTEYLNEWLNKQEEFPVIDGGDVYFIYKQKKEIPVYLTGDMNQWNPKNIPLLKIVGTEYYYVRQSYPKNSALEYLFKAGNKSLLDPLNKRITKEKDKQTSVLFMNEFDFPLETLIRRDQVYTQLDTITFSGNEIFIYRSPSVKNNAPIIFFINGKDYLEFGQANIILDNLVNDNKIPSCIAVFIPLNIKFRTVLQFIKQKFDLYDNKIIIGGPGTVGLSLLSKVKDGLQNVQFVFLQSPRCVFLDLIR